ncbi:hypothetical protein X560_2478 [Listeria fleischmannii 1991]|uniref:Uncharacterized protein n=1 Tax=Listeria fleischmannii 1991 TaxID=1430899 RepID=A0A0J8G658_9LIST|nr:hypothetical protein X560_2478 [Listeria fleischmannii 1991]
MDLGGSILHTYNYFNHHLYSLFVKMGFICFNLSAFWLFY